MKLNKYLLKYQPLLQDAKTSFGLMSFWRPSIKGRYGDYDVEIGFSIQRTDTFDRYYAAKLRNPPRIPFFVSFYLHLKGGYFVRLERLFHIFYDTAASRKQFYKALDKETDASRREKLDKFLAFAHKIDNREMSCDAFIRKQIRTNKKIIALIIFIICASLLLAYVVILI